MPVKTNERELAGKVVQWFDEQIKRMPNAPFTGATAEPGIKSGGKTYFGDVVVWEDRQSNRAYSYIELKKPFGEAEDLETFGKKAVELGVSVAYTWDFQTLKAYEVKDGGVKPLDSENQPVLDKIEDWLQGHKQAAIKAFIARICAELAGFSDKKKFSKFTPDKFYFVNFIREKTRQLIPVFEEFVREKSKDRKHKGKISEYAVRQGIHLSSENEYYGLIAKQTVYGIVTKIIFYMTVRRWFEDDLPPLISEDDADVGKSVRNAFLQAQEIDWQAVFSEGPIEELGLPRKSFGIFQQLFAELKIYNFGELPEDVVGELFEEIIDPEERHSLGQFYTNTDLVDLIIACVVHDYSKAYADPTCGSGTFLIRLYDRLRFLKPGISHKKRLSGIWGIDIGKFPAELSTINLFRQQPGNRTNFPRVVNRDVFQVKAGEQFEFPPLRTTGANYTKIKTKLPEFEALVGNFPFIRQETIEKKVKGFKKELTKLIAEDWLFEYADMFDLNKKKNSPIKTQEIENLKSSKDEGQIKRQISKWVDGGFLDLKLSGQADIYAYLFIHCSTFLGKNGQIAIITSNSWLDAAYGETLKKFLLRHFKVKMIVASWAEPWFQDAAVNTVFTVLEKEKNSKERENNTVRFVKLKKKLSEIVPQVDLEIQSRERWEGTDRIVRIIETDHIDAKKVTGSVSSFENDEMRVRMIGQKDIESEVAEQGEMSKWGKFLRAPDVYFEIIEKCKHKLVPLSTVADVRFGIKTGINDFFYLKPIGKAEGKYQKCKNSRGWSGEIEKVYLKKVIKSPRESDRIKINPDNLTNVIFLCSKSKGELKKLRHTGALQYIEWGEKQKTKEGIRWTDVSSVRNRRYWYGLNYGNPGTILMQMITNDRFLIYLNEKKVCVDHNLFEFLLKDKDMMHSSINYMNSSLFALIREVHSRANLGEGATKTEGIDWKNLMLIPSKPLSFPSKLPTRAIQSISDEVEKKDKIELDKKVLEALGLKSEDFLSRIHEGLVQVVKERIELPKMRKTIRQKREQISYEDVKKSVTEDCIGEGVTKFPDGFYFGEGEYENLEFDAYSTTGEPLEYERFMVEYKLKDGEGNEVFNVEGEEKARLAKILSKQPDMFEIRIPKDRKIVKSILKRYNSYRKDLKERIINDALGKLHDWAKAERLAKEIFEEWGIDYE